MDHVLNSNVRHVGVVRGSLFMFSNFYLSIFMHGLDLCCIWNIRDETSTKIRPPFIVGFDDRKCTCDDSLVECLGPSNCVRC